MPSLVSLSDTGVGATRRPDGNWQFLVWAPNHGSVSLHLCQTNDVVPMESLAQGYHRAIVSDLRPGASYFYRLDHGPDVPDPASRFQPLGVHGPSQLVDTDAFHWTDQNWKGRALESSIFYELHVGVYTPEGTFDGLIPHLSELVELGITTIEIMPVAQFPGPRNWGYDGTYPFAPQNSYGGPEGLQCLINAAHCRGLAVALDVVYNHLGPEGNYLNAYGPYFTDRYRTVWGQAVNFDGQGSDEVRRFFRENAMYWFEEFHLDALRLDAVHGIFDFGAHHFLAELKVAASELSQRIGRPLHLIAESDLNDSRLLHDSSHGGYGIDAQWSDDFHHSVHTLLTRENRGYYQDFGDVTALVSTLEDGWYYHGQHSAFRQRHHGNSPRGLTPSRFVVSNQNHDQVGNRAAGERLTGLVAFEALKLAAGITLLSPFIPLLFMGEEYGETAPFQYFTSHRDPALAEAVARGRRQEFASFGWQDSVPDPQDEKTFHRSRLDHSLKSKDPRKTLFRFYQQLIRMRSKLSLSTATSHSAHELGERQLLLSYENSSWNAVAVFNFAEFPVTLDVPVLAGNWTTLMYSASRSWDGPEPSCPTSHAVHELKLSPFSFWVFQEQLSTGEVQ